jgi:hypothetical protein
MQLPLKFQLKPLKNLQERSHLHSVFGSACIYVQIPEYVPRCYRKNRFITRTRVLCGLTSRSKVRTGRADF